MGRSESSVQGLEVLLVSRCKYDSSNATSVSMHSHTFYQLICIVSGEGELNVLTQRYSATQSMVFLIKPGEMHAIVSSEHMPLQTIEVKFNANSTWVGELSQINTAGTIDTNFNRVVFLLERIIDEAVNKNYMHEMMISIFFSELIIMLLRKHKSDIANYAPVELVLRNMKLTAEYKVIEKIVEYVDKNYTEKITLTELSEISGFSEIHLCRLFKKIFGMSLVQYINMLRLNKAKELLVYSTNNITEIAEASGFNSIHYFSRYFTEKEGVSPLEFRRNIKNNVYVFFDRDMSPEYTDDHKKGNIVNDNIYII